MTSTIKKSQWVLFFSLYATQYIGIGFLTIAVVAIMRSNGSSLEQISYIYALGLPWMIKFLFAPIIDTKCLYHKLGHYRSWLLVLQLLMVALLIVLSRHYVLDDMNSFLLFGFMFSLASAVQDVATDGLATCEFSDAERGMLNGIQTGGSLFGNLIGGGVVLMLYQFIGWQGAHYLLAGVTLITWLQLLFYKESVHAHKTELSTTKTFARILNFWKAKRQWLAFVCLLPISYSMAYAIMTPLMTDIGKSMAEIGFIMNIFGMSVGIAGSIVGGIVTTKLGKYKALLIFSILLAVATAVMTPLVFYVNTLNLYILVTLYFASYTMIVTAFSATAMSYADEHNTQATDYSVQYALMMTMSMIASGIALQIAGALSYSAVMMIALVMSILLVMVSMALYKNNHTQLST